MIAQLLRTYFGGCRSLADEWNRFWFTASSSRLLGLMRILVGGMLVYTHLIWSLELQAFFSDRGVLPPEYARLLYDDAPGLWTHFSWIQTPGAMWTAHAVALATMVLFTLGLWSRFTAILSLLWTISYAHRATGALFGLDQINTFLTLYLALGPCGEFFSLDRWIRRRRRGMTWDRHTVMANISLRLMQVHLCVVYLFAGLAKLQGTSWWDGEAIWGAIASADYQSWDVTGLAGAMWFVNLVTLVSIAWEISYPFLIWNRALRPFYLTLAVVVHLGIGIFMSMITFGLIMIIANMAFLPPDLRPSDEQVEQGTVEWKTTPGPREVRRG